MGCMPILPPCPMPMLVGCYPVLLAMPVVTAQTLVREIEVDATATSRTAFTGGGADSRLTVEYYVESGAPAPAVTLTMVTSGQTTTWSDQAIAPGYYTHQQLPAMPPGTKVTLQATDALARLRWCETVCC